MDGIMAKKSYPEDHPLHSPSTDIAIALAIAVGVVVLALIV